jgi:hypothetical protein
VALGPKSSLRRRPQTLAVLARPRARTNLARSSFARTRVPSFLARSASEPRDSFTPLARFRSRGFPKERGSNARSDQSRSSVGDFARTRVPSEGAGTFLAHSFRARTLVTVRRALGPNSLVRWRARTSARTNLARSWLWRSLGPSLAVLASTPPLALISLVRWRLRSDPRSNLARSSSLRSDPRSLRESPEGPIARDSSEGVGGGGCWWRMRSDPSPLAR